MWRSAVLELQRRGLGLQLDLDLRLQRAAECRGVDAGADVADGAVGQQPTHPLGHGVGAQVHQLAELAVREPAVACQVAEEISVDAVHGGIIRSGWRIRSRKTSNFAACRRAHNAVHEEPFVMPFLRLLLVLVLAATSLDVAVSWGQAAPRVDAAVRRQVVDAVVRELNQRYVFPDVARQVEAALRNPAELAAFEGLDDGKAFADKLTARLQELTRDKHIRVRFSAQPVPDRVAGAPSAAETGAPQGRRACAELRRRARGAVARQHRPDRVARLRQRRVGR
jgi:hypothetical protein